MDAGRERRRLGRLLGARVGGRGSPVALEDHDTLALQLALHRPQGGAGCRVVSRTTTLALRGITAATAVRKSVASLRGTAAASLGAEACWVASLRLADGTDEDRASVLENLAMLCKTKR